MDRISSQTRRLCRLALIGAVAACAGCSTMGDRGRSLVPTGSKARLGPFLVASNRKLDADETIVRQLRAVEAEVSETLGVKADVGDNPIEVFILDDRRAFSHFLQFYHPDLPPRRAFFLARGEQRSIYAYWGDRLDEDLRHEATHALLHATVGDIPLWLDEGLAEYFEGPGDRGGINAEHLGRLPADLQAGWAPNLARLESLRSVKDLSPRDYRECWAWVHYLLNDSKPHKAALLAYLADLRANPTPRPLSDRIEPGTAAGVVAHLGEIRGRSVASDRPTDATVRLQDGPEEPTAAPPPRKRGILARIAGFFAP